MQYVFEFSDYLLRGSGILTSRPNTYLYINST